MKKLLNQIINNDQDRLIDYSKYFFTTGELIQIFIIGFLGALVIGYIFYSSVILAIIFAFIGGIIFIPIRRNQLNSKRRRILINQFKFLLESLSTLLAAGKTVDSAFLEVEEDLKLQYTNQSYIYKEIHQVNLALKNNENIIVPLKYFAERSNVEDIKSFVDIFEATQGKTSEISGIIRNVESVIREKMEIEMEIETMITEKKNEQNVIMVMPIIFVLLFKSMGGALIDLTEPIGKVAVTVALVFFIIAYFISKKILDIKV